MTEDTLVSKDVASKYAKAKIRRHGAAPRISRSIIAVIFTMLVFLGWWASVTEIKEVARATGEIAPTGALVEVQHQTGGVLADVYRQAGETVAAGDPIAMLAPDRLQAEYDQLAIRSRKLTADIGRFRAMLAEMPTDITAPTGPGDTTQQIQLASAQLETFMAKRSSQSKRIRQYAEAVRLARRLHATAVEREKLARRRAEAYQTLFQKGAVSRSDFEERQQEAQKLRSEMLGAEAKLQSEIANHQDAQSSYDELLLETRETNLNALNDAAVELDQVNSQIADIQVQLEDLTLRAPTSGVIQKFHGGSVGEVLAPGEPLAEILPTELDLVAEIELSPKDVGHVAVGDPVSVQITSFDQKRFGKLHGTVDTISATTEINAQDRPVFRVRVVLERTVIGSGDDQRPIRAGMEANAEILTSSRTIAEYLLKPIDSTLSKALAER